VPRQVLTKKDVGLIQHQLQEAAKLRQQMGAVAGAEPIPDIKPDEYKDRLLKYIPADIIAVYLALRSLVDLVKNRAAAPVVYFVIFGIILLVTIPWQRKVAKIRKWQQVWIGFGAFIVWAISLGEPFTANELGSWYDAAYGAMLLVLYTFLIPLFAAEK
jgi:hypothetical protein